MSSNTISIKKLRMQTKKMNSEEIDYPVHCFESKLGQRNIGTALKGRDN